MKFVNIDFSSPREETLEMICDNETVNKNVRFEDGAGTPLMKIKEKKNNRIRITCEMIGRATRDNGFLVGTYFSGKLIEKDGQTKLSGVILTAPIYHLFLLAMVIVFVIKCLDIGNFALLLVPAMLILFDIFMFKDEFKKQGYIHRYLFRAARRIENLHEKH